MKEILILIFMLFALKSWGVVTKDCPDSILVELRDVYQLELKVDPENDERSFERALQELDDLEHHIAQLRLTEKKNSQCHYVGKGPFGKYLSIKLEGSLKPNAVKPARAVYSIGNNYVIFINLSDINPMGIIPSTNKKIKVFYPGQSCYYGCSLKYIPMAIVENVNIN